MSVQSRRTFLSRALVSLGLAGTEGVIARATGGPRRGLAHAADGWTPVAGLPPEVTPIGRFYTVSKNVFDPALDAKTWKLTITGKVERPYSLTYEELRQLPAVEKPHTLMCISNEVGGDLISNATWKGVSLRAILERAGIKPGAIELILRARDGYSDSFPLGAGLRDGTILAHEMNGQPLERQHGFPARALVMGLYGIKNVKWLTELEVADYDYKGYWAARGWSDTATYKTFSRIDVPQPRARVRRSEPSWIAGVAFAGDRGIQAVEVSADAGKTWQSARLKPAMGNHTWVLWALEWTPAAAGRVTVVVRAVDGAGTLQPVGPTPPLPDGVEGYHAFSVAVT